MGVDHFNGLAVLLLLSEKALCENRNQEVLADHLNAYRNWRTWHWIRPWMQTYLNISIVDLEVPRAKDRVEIVGIVARDHEFNIVWHRETTCGVRNIDADRVGHHLRRNPDGESGDRVGRATVGQRTGQCDE